MSRQVCHLVFNEHTGHIEFCPVYIIVICINASLGNQIRNKFYPLRRVVERRKLIRANQQILYIKSFLFNNCLDNVNVKSIDRH